MDTLPTPMSLKKKKNKTSTTAETTTAPSPRSRRHQQQQQARHQREEESSSEEEDDDEEDPFEEEEEEEEEDYEDEEEMAEEEEEEEECRGDADTDSDGEGSDEDEDLGPDPIHITVQLAGSDACKILHFRNEVKLAEFRSTISAACELPSDSKFIIARKRKTKPPQQIMNKKHFDYMVDSYFEHDDQFLRILVTPAAGTATTTISQEQQQQPQQQAVSAMSTMNATGTVGHQTINNNHNNNNNTTNVSSSTTTLPVMATFSATSNSLHPASMSSASPSPQQPSGSSGRTTSTIPVAPLTSLSSPERSAEDFASTANNNNNNNNSQRPTTGSIRPSSSMVRPSSSYAGSSMMSPESDTLRQAFENGEEVTWTQMKLLGRGAFGEVYEAITSTGQIVAVKHLVFPGGANSTTANEEAKKASEVEQMVEEIRLMKNLRHRHIVGYYGCQTTTTGDGGRVVDVFMEACHGGSLNSLRKKLDKINGRLKVGLVRGYIKQVLAGLDYIHLKGVVHRDLKSDNVLISSSGVAKLADFGCSKKLGGHSFEDTWSLEMKHMDSSASGVSTSTSSGSVSGSPQTLAAAGGKQDAGAKTLVGTPLFIAPEVLTESDGGYLHSADIWSLGCLILELFGKKPWNLQSQSIFSIMFAIAQSKSLPTGMPDQCDEKLKSFLVSCFNREPSQRPTARQLLEHPWITCPDNELVEPIWQSDQQQQQPQQQQQQQTSAATIPVPASS